MEAKPGSKLRSLAITALYNDGYAGPNYNLDDVPAYVHDLEGAISVSFWDMSTVVQKNSPLYKEMIELLR